eukprot:11551380-Alexandrium_andersonii.AAC.1
MSASLVGSEMCIRDSNWLRPAPVNSEIHYKDVCRKWQANLCQLQSCPRRHRCAGRAGTHPLWRCKGRLL